MAETDTNDEAFPWEMILGKLEPELRDLFNQIRNIDRGCALIRFLDSQARTLMSIDDIAYHLIEPPQVIEIALAALADLDLVQRVDVTGVVFFGLTVNPKRRGHVHDLCEWQGQWHARLERIRHMIDGNS